MISTCASAGYPFVNTMSDIAIRVENLSKLYPAVAPRARHLGRAQQRHDTLRDELLSVFSRQSSVVSRQPRLATDNSN